MNIFGPGSMTSTHTGNPIICAAATANLKFILKKKLTQNAAKLGKIMAERVAKIRDKYPERVGWASCIGLVGSLQMVKTPGSTTPDHDAAFDIVKHCVERGLLMFGPVGNGGGSVKLAPPLTITKDQLVEGLDVLEAAFDEVLK
jgi:4-aminobutyrate aminotransferase-like enzyme